MNYPGRKLPLKIQAGKSGEPPPLNVSHLSEGRIILRGGRQHLGIYEFQREVPFLDEGKLWENEDLFSKLVDLNACGVPFQSQPKEMDSPDILMAWWQETGKLKVSFKEISWRGTGKWFITTVEPPIIGIRGWAGPKPFGC
ncbi:hypothetical protein EHS39_13715 [Ensifer sp. MPMI2T]|nr:hypothetical protein EHS39_13715 [Ensifer sp. MPMI2T]